MHLHGLENISVKATETAREQEGLQDRQWGSGQDRSSLTQL